MTGIVKSSVRKPFHRTNKTLEEPRTIITEIEDRVNNCPSTYSDDSSINIEDLTPLHLCGLRVETIPLLDISSETDDTTVDDTQFRLLQSLRESFYVAQLLENCHPFKEKDKVLVKCNNLRS